MINSLLTLDLGDKYAQQYLLYTRKSTDDADNQKNSIEFQIKEGTTFATYQGLQIAQLTIDTFCENGVIKEHHSGFKEDEQFQILEDGTINHSIERPKFLLLVNLLQKKYFKGIICLCWDRFSRNEGDDVIIKKLLRQGIDIRFTQATYDKSSSGALHMDIDGMFSRHYSRVISEKVRNAAGKLRAEGKCIYQAPIGYFDEGSHLKSFDPVRAPIVKNIFELYATGGWSYSTLASWAQKQGLTTKPVRRKRTKEEKLLGLPLESIAKISRPVTAKSIEHILKNPFYIGKNVYNGRWENSIAHQPLIDEALFFRVRKMLEKRTQYVHYPQPTFFVYRRLVKCGYCERLYTPYMQKGIVYYSSKCKEGCVNTVKNVNEDFINTGIANILERVFFSDEELSLIEKQATEELNSVAERRNKDLEELYRTLNKTMADMDYLMRERLTLLRTGSMTMEGLIEEETRLKAKIESIELKIKANTESTKVMLDYILSFSDLVKNAYMYFSAMLDSEKRDLVTKVFSELIIKDGDIIYEANEGYEALLTRFNASLEQSGWPHYFVSELETIYKKVRIAAVDLQLLDVLR